MINTLTPALQHLMLSCRKLDDEQGRIARRNARRAVIGALRRVRSALNADYPAIAKVTVVRDPLDVAADRMSWRQFEYHVIKQVRLNWSLDVALRFNQHCAKVFGVAAKPIMLDSSLVHYLGMHYPDRIVIATGQTREQKWRTLMHEIAHYHPRKRVHGRAFVRDLAQVYRLWREFRSAERIAARTDRHEPEVAHGTQV